MSLYAYVSYHDTSSVDSTGARIETWRANIKLSQALQGLQQTYHQLQSPRETKPLLADSLSLSASSLDEASERAMAAIQELTGIKPLRARIVDLRHLDASPAVVEEFKVAKDARKVA